MAAGQGEVSTERGWNLLWTVTGHGGETLTTELFSPS